MIIIKITAIIITMIKNNNNPVDGVHGAHGEHKQGACSSVSDQAGVKQLATGSKSPVNNGQEAAHTRHLSNNGLFVISTNNVAEPKNTEQKWSRDEYSEVRETFYTATLFPI